MVAIAIAACAVIAASACVGVLAGLGAFDGASASAARKSDAYYENGTAEVYYVETTDEAVEYGYDGYANGAGTSLYTEISEEAAAKIIYTASIRLQSTEFDSSLSAIEDLVNSCGAYFESKNISNSSGSYRSADMTVRVPVAHYNEFLSQIDGTATVTSIHQSAEDVSESYYDIESRLATAKTKLKRLQELLAEAENMEDIITLEDSISDTEWVIDELQGTLNNYDSRVQYSTVTMTLSEVYKVQEVQAPATFGDKISSSFKDGLAGFAEAMGNLLLWFAASWTWLLFILAIIAVIVVIIVLCVRKKRSRRNN